MRFQDRSAFGWGASGGGWADPTRGLVIHYDGSDQNLAGKSHSACVSYWKGTRRFHMGGARGWSDIGYSFGACPHGYIMEGRGLNRAQAAQRGANSTWYSCTLMSGPGERPTDEQIGAVRQLRSWLMGKGVRGAVAGHRDFNSTSCPGGVLYDLVQSGAFEGDAKPYRWDGQAPDGSPLLGPGDSGWAVRDLQHALLAVGEQLPEFGADGDFGDETEAAVEAFQRAHGLDADGVYGPDTARKLRDELAARSDEDESADDDQEDEDDMAKFYYGELMPGPGAVTAVSVYAGAITWAGFLAGKGETPARLRVSAHFTDGTWGEGHEVVATPDGKKETVKLAEGDKAVDGFCVERLDNGDTAVGWDAT